ncbi:RTX toxin transporter, ATP-binding protein [Labilithrix luteola]|uniref:RTX toxin transporter, ATP-binding protein n=2 Tax=Labilithrix luteola TaxID=1391654 RepID=A0A0K1Q5Y5_9BACT|nr:RTX toxin transporter, ATP-binding protein [Labilithrix luteola]
MDVYRKLFGRLSSTTRTQIGVAAVVGVAARLAVVGAALRVTQGDALGAGIVGVVGAMAFALQRALLAAARVGSEVDLYSAVSRSLLEGDVLRVPSDDLQRVVFDTNHHARGALAQAVPSLASDVVASLVLVPVIAAAVPGRVLLLASGAFVVVLATLAALRGVTGRLQERVVQAFEEVSDALLVVTEARQEVVARGGDAAFSATVDAALARYASLAKRTVFATALLGRAPFAVGAAAVVFGVLLDPASKQVLASTLLANALLLAACAPPLLGVVFGVHELVRARPLVRPLATILNGASRPELARAGQIRPTLPAAFDVRALGFAYDDGLDPVLREVSLRWSAGTPLVLTGPNGSGKSTLLRLLTELRPPSNGAVIAGDVDLLGADLQALRREVAYLPQRSYLGEGHRSVRDAMRLVRDDATDDAMTTALERTKVLEALRTHGMEPLDVRVGELSTGQRQRVALARVLLADAKLVLLDEPDANLDARGIKLVAELIRELTAQGKMVAVAAHTPELAEMPATRVVLG